MKVVLPAPLGAARAAMNEVHAEREFRTFALPASETAGYAERLFQKVQK